MIKGLKKSLILSCALAFLLPSVASADMYVTRFARADRYTQVGFPVQTGIKQP